MSRVHLLAALVIAGCSTGGETVGDRREGRDAAIVHDAGAMFDDTGPMGVHDTGTILVNDARPMGACLSALNDHASVGCDYWATFMDTSKKNGCFAAVVANTASTPAHLAVEYDGKPIAVDQFARIPSGAGASLKYSSFDAKAGLAPGQVAILFLSGPSGELEWPNAPCPVPSAVPTDVLLLTPLGVGRSGIGRSFHITTDVPVVAYQINPYGGGSAAVTGASLLLPTSVWNTNYIAVNAYGGAISGLPSLNIVASENGTHVTFLPTAAVEGGSGIPAGPAHVPLTFTLERGQHAQLSQAAELSGSIVQSDKPIGVMAGHQCMVIPSDSGGPCDHGEQMLVPIKALGSEYVGVMYSPRTTEPALWRVIGAVDGTTLTWSTNVGGPTTLGRGQVVEFVTSTPFVVKSQDDTHPFILFEHMSSNGWDFMTYDMIYVGDPDSVLAVPPNQFLTDYVFFADPTYPVTNLVVVRKKLNGAFADVDLDCAGVLGGWQPVGDYQYTRVFLNQGNFEPVGKCDTGRHEMKSQAPFGLWVWGWGGPWTGDPRNGGLDGGVITQSVSYAYPAGMNVAPINDVIVPPR
jgi:hypothetical protein